MVVLGGRWVRSGLGVLGGEEMLDLVDHLIEGFD